MTHRIHEGADPRLLRTDDLLIEHGIVHKVLDGEVKASDPDYRRFDSLGMRGRSLLILRHELLRVGLALRFQNGVRTHGRDEHPTPVDLTESSERAQAVLLRYERHALPPLRIHRWDREGDLVVPTPPGYTLAECQRYFIRLMRVMRWPDPSCTPWREAGIPVGSYLSNRLRKGST